MLTASSAACAEHNSLATNPAGVRRVERSVVMHLRATTVNSFKHACHANCECQFTSIGRETEDVPALMDRVIKSLPLFPGQREILRQTLPRLTNPRVFSVNTIVTSFRPCRRFRGEKPYCASIKRLLLRRRSPELRKICTITIPSVRSTPR